MRSIVAIKSIISPNHTRVASSPMDAFRLTPPKEGSVISLLESRQFIGIWVEIVGFTVQRFQRENSSQQRRTALSLKTNP